jgi:hypothetical protein
MNLNPAQQILWDMEVLYRTTMELYESYFKMLEAAIEKTPTSEVARLSELYELAREGEEALEADMAFFDKAVSMDAESLTKIQEKLQIESLYKKIQKQWV